MRKKKNTSKLLLLIIIVFILIIITIVNIVSITKNENKQEPSNIVEEENLVVDKEFNETIENVQEEFINNGQIVPENYNFLVRLYEGPVDSDELYNKLYEVIYKDIPETLSYTYGKSQDEIINYFNQNSSIIGQMYGIDNSTDFINFVTKISDINGAEYSSSIFDVENLKDVNEYTELEFKVKYSNGKEISFILKLVNSNNTNNRNIVIY